MVGAGIGNQPRGEGPAPFPERGAQVTVQRELPDLARTGRPARAHHPHSLQHQRGEERNHRAPHADAPAPGLQERPERRRTHERRTGVARHEAGGRRDRRVQRPLGSEHHGRKHQRHARQVQRLAEDGHVHLLHRRHGHEHQGQQETHPHRCSRAHQKHEGGDRHECGNGFHQAGTLRRRHAETHRNGEHGGVARRKVGERRCAVRARPRCHGNAVFRMSRHGLRRAHVGERIRVQSRSRRIGDHQHQRKGGGARQHCRKSLPDNALPPSKNQSHILGIVHGARPLAVLCHRGSGCIFGIYSVNTSPGA